MTSGPKEDGSMDVGQGRRGIMHHGPIPRLTGPARNAPSHRCASGAASARRKAVAIGPCTPAPMRSLQVSRR